MNQKTKKRFGLRCMVLLLLILVMLPPTTALAAEDVSVSFNICPTRGWATDEQIGYFGIFGTQPPLLLQLPDGHKDMYIMLEAAFSVAFTDDITDVLNGVYHSEYENGTPVSDFIAWLLDLATSEYPPGIVGNVYSVQFRDYDGNVVWTENNAIPNGGSREFFVGSNVKCIAVRSWYDLGMFESIKAKIPGSVTYQNAREIVEEVPMTTPAPVPTVPNTGTADPALIAVASNPSGTEKVNRYYWKSNFIKGQYEGDWKNGAPNGRGKLTYDKDETVYRYTLGDHKALYYEGNFVDGVRSGYGTVVYEDGYKQEGEFFGIWEAGKVVFQGKCWPDNGTDKGYWPLITTATGPAAATNSFGEWQPVK